MSAGGGDEEGYLRVSSGVRVVGVVVVVDVDVVRREGGRGQERRGSRPETRGRRADVEGVRLRRGGTLCGVWCVCVCVCVCLNESGLEGL